MVVSSTTMSSTTMDPHHHVRTIISLTLADILRVGHVSPALTMVLLGTWPTPPNPYYHFPDITDILVTIMFPALPWSSSKHYPWPPCPYYHFPDITDILVTIMFPALPCPPLPWTHTTMSVLSFPWHYGHGGVTIMFPALPWSSSTMTHTTMSVLSFPYITTSFTIMFPALPCPPPPLPTPPCPYYHFPTCRDILSPCMFPALPWSSSTMTHTTMSVLSFPYITTSFTIMFPALPCPPPPWPTQPCP